MAEKLENDEQLGGHLEAIATSIGDDLATGFTCTGTLVLFFKETL